MPGVIEVVRRSSQRGGRMLSVLDLVDAGTLARPVAAWLLARVWGGASWLVGARPGGAGKTTIMGALLAMLPAEAVLHVATPASGWRRARAGECVVAYEISPGDYEAYVWDEELRSFAALGERGCRLVSNLHADTLEQAREQIVGANRVPARTFDRFGLFLPIRLAGSGRQIRPVVAAVWQAAAGAWERVAEPRLGEDEKRVERWLERALQQKARTIEEVRADWLSFQRDGGSARPAREDDHA